MSSHKTDQFFSALSQFELTPHEKKNQAKIWAQWSQEKATQRTNLEPVTANVIEHLSHLPGVSYQRSQNLAKKLVVLKLNGGLGTSMGCQNAKSSIVIKNNASFMDLIIEQIKNTNRTYNTDVPLILLNSFHTHQETLAYIKQTPELPSIYHLQQSKFVRIEKASCLPVNYEEFQQNAYYPPGHGDVYHTLAQNNILDKLINEGKEFLFLSNADNLAATVDFRILQWMEQEKLDFLMEVTPKTKNDAKGGIIVQNEGKLLLLESAQIAHNLTNQANQADQAAIFNTNNLWINIRSLQKQMASGHFSLPIIANHKIICGKQVIQLETAMGAAASNFDAVKLLVTDRSRFVPVKTCNDLFLIQSDFFVIDKGCLIPAQKNMVSLPYIDLGQEFQTLDQYNAQIASIPSLRNLKSLVVQGKVFFSEHITLSGKVSITAGKKGLHLPQASTLNNQAVKGELTIEAIKD